MNVSSLPSPTAADSAPAGGPAGVHPGRVRGGRRLRARHQRDDGATAPVGAVPADGVCERGAGGVLAGASGSESQKATAAVGLLKEPHPPLASLCDIRG